MESFFSEEQLNNMSRENLIELMETSAKIQPNKVIHTAANAPYMMAWPISIPNNPAAASGPGVGGTYT